MHTTIKIYPSIYEKLTDRFQRSGLRPELLGVLSLSPFNDSDSASRKQMFSSHISQCLVIDGSTERKVRTGREDEYGKYTFSVKTPTDIDIIRVIERYPRTLDGSIAHNPETIVIYEESETKKVGYISLTDYFSHHQYFGFKYKRTPAIAKIRDGASIAADTILQDSPSITPNGGYKYGLELNVAFMTHPAVSEDGMLVCRDVLPKLKFTTREERVVEFGKNQFPINKYGTPDEYKPFPDIGEVIGPDGILMAFRTYDDNFNPVEQSRFSTMKNDPFYDKAVYADGPGGKIIDIQVMHDPESEPPLTPFGMELQATKYDVARRKFYTEILSVYDRLRKSRREKLSMTEEMSHLIVEAISVVDSQRRVPGSDKENTERVQKTYKAIPLDDWRIKFIIEYEITPDIGFKITDAHGGKGVICAIAEPHEMPVDADGRRADIVRDPISVSNRMNLGGPYEMMINSTSSCIVRRLIQAFGGDPNISPMAIATHPYFEEAKRQILRFYELTSPRTHYWFTNGLYTKPFENHISHVLKEGSVIDGIDVYYPTDNEVYQILMTKLLQKEFNPTYGPVSYIGFSGQRKTTKYKVRIGSMYIILLEKTGDGWTASSSGRLQNFGVLGQLTAKDKYSQPSRFQSIRVNGETEVRIDRSYVGPYITAEIFDRNNSIATHQCVVNSIFNAENPSNIPVAVDRNEIPYGNPRPNQLVKHLALCGGWKFVSKPYVPHPKTDNVDFK